MRRGRATVPHPSSRPDGDGGWLVSAQIIATLLVVHRTTVLRRLSPRACDVRTKVLLYDEAEAASRWAVRELNL